MATDALGNQTVQAVEFELRAGIGGEPYRAVQNTYDAAGDFTGQTFFRNDGKVLYRDTYAPGPDGGSIFTYSGGPYFKGKAEKSFVDTYAADGSLETQTIINRDGSHASTACAPGQSLIPSAVNSDR